MEKHTNGRRQILMALASLAGGLLLPGTGRAALQTQEAHHMLVVFYSHTGNTRAIARHIQALTGCDLLDLEPVTPYPRDYDTVVSQAKKEKQQGFLPPLKNPLDMVSRYDVILVGSPSWWGTFAGPVPRRPWTEKRSSPSSRTKGPALAALLPTCAACALPRRYAKGWPCAAAG